MMTAAPPFFSVVIPTYNRRPYLEKAMASVLAQTYLDFEVIVIDDGSEDQTQELVRQYADSRIHYIYQENRGVAHARNRGLACAQGQFVAFLDSDDWWVKQKLARTHEFICRYPDVLIFHSEEIWYRQGRLLPQKLKHRKPDGWVYAFTLPLCCISISTAVIHRHIFDVVGVFDEGFEACEDYDFWLRATYHYPVKLIPETLTLKDGGRDDQLSARIWGLDRFRIRALAKMLASGQLTAGDYWATWEAMAQKCEVFSQGAEKRGRTEEAQTMRDLVSRYQISAHTNGITY